jgi:hypothetical protein
LALAALGIFGAIFSSIEFAFAYVILVAVPLTIGLLGAGSNVKVFTFLVLFGCITPVVYIVYIYIHNAIEYPNSHTSFIHERIGWVNLSLNLLQALLAATRLKQKVQQNGVTQWPL